MRRMREQAARSDPLAELSERERRILELIGEGLTNRKIGERMFPAEKTVKNYVSALFAKLGLERRTQAAVYAARVMHEDESYSGVVMNANCNSNVLLAVDLMPGEPTWHIRPATNMTREMVRDRADHVAVVLVPRADLPSGAESPRPDLMVTGHQGL